MSQQITINITVPDAVVKLSKVFCGCGNPGLAWKSVHNELARLADFHDNKNLQGNDPPTGSGTWWMLAYLLNYLKLTDHGSSIMWAWLTEDGKDVLKFLNEYGYDLGGKLNGSACRICC